MPVKTIQKLKPLAFSGLAITLFSLSACGIKGPLETPPPLWGDEKPKSDETKPAEKAKDESIFDSSPIDNKNDEDDIFGDSYLESDEPF